MSTTYTIQMASKISGVGVHTIRAWEKRYKALEPNRDASGHRTYTKIDVEKLMLLSELCLLGYTISKVAKLSIPELKNLLKDLGKTEESIEAQEFNLVKEKPTIDIGQSMTILSFAFRAYKLDVISQELGKLKSVLGPRELALQVVVPVLGLLAEGLQRGEITANQSQVLKAILKFHLSYALYRPIEKRERSNINIVLGGVEGDTSLLEQAVVGLLCNHYGFNYTFLGESLGGEALGEAAKIFEAHLLIIGPTNISLQLGKSHLHNFLDKVIHKILPQTEILLAGRSEVDADKFSGKKFFQLKTIEAIDEYLAKKTY